MLCPVCAVELTMADRQGIEIDYCPKCRGVWLDRGELDKILERSGAIGAPAPPAAPAAPPPSSSAPREPYREPPRDAYREPPRERRYRDDDDDDDYKRKKRKHWLEELFD